MLSCVSPLRESKAFTTYEERQMQLSMQYRYRNENNNSKHFLHQRVESSKWFTCSNFNSYNHVW